MGNFSKFYAPARNLRLGRYEIPAKSATFAQDPIKPKDMTREERHAAIMDMLIQQNSITVIDMAERLQVSSVTIRKDLTELERSKKLYRSHGKAILISPYITNRNVNVKEKLCIEEKRLIGKVAASLIVGDDSVMLASGTTIHALARSISVNASKLTVVTASLQSAEILAGQANVEIVQLGGILRHSSLSVVGSYAESILTSFFCSKLFLGVDGIDLEFGVTTTDMREANLNQVMMRAAQKTIVLADSTKFGRRGFAKIADMEDVDMIITDSHVKPSTVKRIEEMGIEIVIATDELAASLGRAE